VTYSIGTPVSCSTSVIEAIVAGAQLLLVAGTIRYNLRGEALAGVYLERGSIDCHPTAGRSAARADPHLEDRSNCQNADDFVERHRARVGLERLVGLRLIMV
jgi:hypothetical protein